MPRELSEEELEFVTNAKKTIQECHPDHMLQESKFLLTESLQVRKIKWKHLHTDEKDLHIDEKYLLIDEKYLQIDEKYLHTRMMGQFWP